MGKQLSKEVSVEVVDVIAEVTSQMGSDLTGNELQLMTAMAKNADSEITEKDVSIISDIVKMIGPEPSTSLVR